MNLTLFSICFALFLFPQSLFAESSCEHELRPLLSKCTGCPPKFEGKLCASTTRYNDLTKGACGCGTDPNPKSFWTKVKYTAALNAKNLDPDHPDLSWCPKHCGSCYRLCTTGGTTSGKETEAGKCIVVQVENRCGDGYHQPQEAQWCRQEMTWNDCESNPVGCAALGKTNNYGYPAHFDLQDANLQISGLSWDNPEVTFEPVSCAQGDFPSWSQSCYCPLGSKGFLAEE